MSKQKIEKIRVSMIHISIIKEELYNNSGIQLNSITTKENGQSTVKRYVTGSENNYREYGEVSLNWKEGTKLESSVKDNITTSYKYDDRGLRHEKMTLKNGRYETVKYYYDGEKLIAEENNAGIKTYHYSGDRPVGINVYGTYYVLITNLQGDVTEVRNLSGDLRASYKYDAWGNCTIEGNESVGRFNNLRYRGYYLDEETGYYYLKARYYDPVTRRFISADSVELEPELALSGQDNLYAYCSNNPVMYTDGTGTSIWSDIGNWFKNNWDIIVGVGLTIGLAVLSIATFGIGTVLTGVVCGAVIGAGFGALNAAVNGDNVLYGMLSGMVVGALGGLGGPGIGGMLMAGITSVAGAASMSLIGDRVNGRQRDFTKAGISALTAGIFSFLGSGAGNFMASAGRELAIQIVGNSLGSFIFGSYTFVSDLIYDAWRV